MVDQDAEQYREHITKLQSEENRPAALNDIKNFLTFKPAEEAIHIIRDVGISKIVQCLNVSDKSHVEGLTCEVLKLCFGKFKVGEVLKNYTGHIMYLLRHEKSCVRRLAIDEVYKTVTTNVHLFPVSDYIDVFVATGQLVCDTDVGVANQAILITSNLPSEAYPKILDEMKIGLEYDSSSKCNIFEVIVNISSKSFELFKLCVDLNYIDFMVSELQTDDVLYQVNILELLSRVAVKPYGINHLVKNGALANISQYVAALPNNPLHNLLLPGYLKFFGCIAHYYPKKIFEKYPVLLNSLFEVFETGNVNILPVALDTLSFLGSTVEGKLCLAALGSQFTQALETVVQIIKNGRSDIKTRALHCFAGLISIEKNIEALGSLGNSGKLIDPRVTLMTREWFRALSSKPMETLLELCKNPFPDIRLASFAILDAVCQHQWGQELVAREAGFIEFLLDRTVVYTKEVNEAKYDIIKKLACSTAFDSNVIEKLNTYVEQGPFYSESVMEVVMEEGD